MPAAVTRNVQRVDLGEMKVEVSPVISWGRIEFTYRSVAIYSLSSTQHHSLPLCLIWKDTSILYLFFSNINCQNGRSQVSPEYCLLGNNCASGRIRALVMSFESRLFLELGVIVIHVVRSTCSPLKDNVLLATCIAWGTVNFLMQEMFKTFRPSIFGLHRKQLNKPITLKFPVQNLFYFYFFLQI